MGQQQCCICRSTIPHLEEDLHIGNIEIIEEVDSLRKKHKEDIERSKVYYQDLALFRGKLNVKGEKEGYGQYYYEQKIYFGMFEKDMPNGQGLAVKNDDCYYRGDFKDGNFDGFGKEYGKNYCYQGSFEKGSRKKGIFRNNQFQYHGNFSKNVFAGEGIIIFENGVRYQGTFAWGKMQGMGVVVFPNGKIFKGQVSNGRCTKGQFEWAKDRKPNSQNEIQMTEQRSEGQIRNNNSRKSIRQLFTPSKCREGGRVLMDRLGSPSKQ